MLHNDSLLSLLTIMLGSNLNSFVSPILSSYANNRTLETRPYFICVLKSVDCPPNQIQFSDLNAKQVQTHNGTIRMIYVVGRRCPLYCI